MLVWRPGADDQACEALRLSQTLEARLQEMGCRWIIREYSAVTDPLLNPGIERNPLLIAAAEEPAVPPPFVVASSRGCAAPFLIIPATIPPDELVRLLRTPGKVKPLTPP
jgi:hypothetical protein